jgi:hypothetical protein
MVLSAVLNHPGRTIGAQIDGAFLTIMGSATGLGWGSFALWLSDSTSTARKGYGGVLATFLVVFMGAISALRSYYIRVYQFVLCAGIAIIYTCLAETSEVINWRKMFNFGIPWVLGQGISLLVCCVIFPDAGARPLAVSLHDAFNIMAKGLDLPQPDTRTLHRELALTFVQASQAHRDLVLDISLTRFKPKDVEKLRNLMQAVIRSLLALKMETHLFDELENVEEKNMDNVKDTSNNIKASRDPNEPAVNIQAGDDVIVNIDENELPMLQRSSTEKRAVKLVADKLAKPTSDLLLCMRVCLARGDAVLMEMSGYRKYIGPPKSVSTDILGALNKIRKTMIKYDEEEDSLMENSELPPTYSNHLQVVELFLFIHPIRQAARSVENLLVKIMEMQQRKDGWRVYLPSYPLEKALQRTNAQVRHDRGGVTAGYYFNSQAKLARMMKGMANIYRPLPREPEKSDNSNDPIAGITRAETLGKYEEEEQLGTNRNMEASREKRLRYRMWMILHRLQGFETRFALKVAIVTGLLSIPAWLTQSNTWWNENESWWAVVSVWIMMQPRYFYFRQLFRNIRTNTRSQNWRKHSRCFYPRTLRNIRSRMGWRILRSGKWQPLRDGRIRSNIYDTDDIQIYTKSASTFRDHWLCIFYRGIFECEDNRWSTIRSPNSMDPWCRVHCWYNGSCICQLGFMAFCRQARASQSTGINDDLLQYHIPWCGS